jgi:hypothetical protein
MRLVTLIKHQCGTIAKPRGVTSTSSTAIARDFIIQQPHFRPLPRVISAPGHKPRWIRKWLIGESKSPQERDADSISRATFLLCVRARSVWPRWDGWMDRWGQFLGVGRDVKRRSQHTPSAAANRINASSFPYCRRKIINESRDSRMM